MRDACRISALAALACSVGIAHADKARDCHAAALKGPPPAPEKPRLLGCFEKIVANSEHATGMRACFVVVDKVCTGTLDIYDSNIEPDRALFDAVSCVDGKVSFSVKRKWRTAFQDVGPVKVEIAFVGKIARGTLRGDLTNAEAKQGIVWRSVKRSFVLEQVRLLEQVARCTDAP